jgi:ribosomal protein S18 acetylase RimI-like enzyme
MMNSSIKVSNHVDLRAITLNDATLLLALMHRIYPPPYKHLWEDGGIWYVTNTFNAQTLKEELSAKNAGFYFVEYETEIVGILRIIHQSTLSDLDDKKATKLHRIYLDSKAQGKGIAKALLDWTIQRAIENKSEILWLESMDTQEQALRFYKKMGFQITGDFRLPFKLMHAHLRGMHRMYKTL